ncbi:MAG: roadblock/LC7 domain-containing protein, partial [Verrucomicrobiota bacterium]|nr:roadblock/LC7 domain-containing protein [Verrucomicrobiota bacterium]
RLGPPVARKPLKGLPQVVPSAPEEPIPAAKEEPDAKTIVAEAAKMAGVKACAIMFGDGLSLAGNLPGEFQAEGLCAMAPSFLQRLGDHLTSTKLGGLRSMTLSCAKAAVTFFMHENLCLAALHTKEELTTDVRERLAQIVQQLSKKYSQPV